MFKKSRASIIHRRGGRIVGICVIFLAMTQALLNYFDLVSFQEQEKDLEPRKASSKSLLVVVPGLGYSERVETLQKSIAAISKSLEQENYGFDCLVYVWNAKILGNATESLKSYCRVRFNQGLWTHHMAKVPPTTASHVAILMDDIDATGVDMVDTLGTMEKSGFGAASPVVDDPDYPFTRRRANCLSHRTDFVNVFFTVMTTPVWQCWQSNIDIEFNKHGWGLDTTLSDLCNTTIGIIDAYEIVHMQVGATSYSRAKAKLEMWRWILSKTGKEARPYLRCTSGIEGRPSLFKECLLYKNGTRIRYDAEANAKLRSFCWGHSYGSQVANETRFVDLPREIH
jgi:Protein of unknown function (DUF707)